MTSRTPIRLSIVACCLAAASLATGPALAQGHGGGGHFGGGYGGHGGYGGRGYGGYRGGYGWHGGYYGGWGGWGWGGLGLGLYFASLPLYYSTLWWGGIPYYYANDTYYVYDGAARQYVTTAPPPGLQSLAATPGSPGSDTVGTDVMAYPKAGQSPEQQAKDKYECHHWAVTQSGFDPTQGAVAAAKLSKRGDYMRAQAACLDGRGYSVK